MEDTEGEGETWDEMLVDVCWSVYCVEKISTPYDCFEGEACCEKGPGLPAAVYGR